MQVRDRNHFVGHRARMFERSAPAPSQGPRPLYVGVDIGKQWLDASGTGLQLKVPNAKSGFEELLAASRKLRRHVHFICEPTGSSADAFVRFLHAKRCKLTLVAGMRVRQFALATRRTAKTDKIDSQVLADFGRTLQPPPSEKHDRTLRRLRQILRRRRQVLIALVLQRQQKTDFSCRALRRNADAVERALIAEMTAVEGLAEEVVSKHPRIGALVAAFCTVKGVGRLTAATVLAELPEIGRLNRRQAAALAGLAPYNRDSGAESAPRHIFGGRTRLRTALYMATVVAQRYNPVLAPFYRRLIKRGKPGRVARIALARKLLVHLNQLAKATLHRLENPGESSAASSSKRRPKRGKPPLSRRYRVQTPAR